MPRETIATLKQRLEQAQEMHRLSTATAAEEKRLRGIAEARSAVLEGENNDLRDRLMASQRENDRMTGYLMRAAEDEQPQIQPPAPAPEPRLRAFIGSGIRRSDHFHDADAYRGYTAAPRDKAKEWYHR